LKLKDKHILITGAAKRLGRAMAEDFLRQGAKISAHYRSSKKEAESLLGFGKVKLIQADLCKQEDIKRCAKEAHANFGAIDVLINSASDFFPTPLKDCTEADWDRLFKINLKAPYFLTQACLPYLKKGVVLNFCDVNATRARKSYDAYLATKAALRMLTKTWAFEFAPDIRVNSVSPGAVLFPENYSQEQIQKAVQRTLLGRQGSEKDIVSAANFLIENEYITGMDLCVDGGRSIY